MSPSSMDTPKLPAVRRIVLDPFDLAANDFLGIERQENSEKIIDPLGKARVIAEKIRNEISLHEIMWHRSEALGPVCV